MNKEILGKFDLAEPLTDKECLELYSFFKNMEEPLLLMGERYFFAWWNITMNRRVVEGYITARGLTLPK